MDTVKAIGGRIHGTRDQDPFGNPIGHEQVINPDGRIICVPIYEQHKKEQPES